MHFYMEFIFISISEFILANIIYLFVCHEVIEHLIDGNIIYLFVCHKVIEHLNSYSLNIVCHKVIEHLTEGGADVSITDQNGKNVFQTFDEARQDWSLEREEYRWIFGILRLGNGFVYGMSPSSESEINSEINSEGVHSAAASEAEVDSESVHSAGASESEINSEGVHSAGASESEINSEGVHSAGASEAENPGS